MMVATLTKLGKEAEADRSTVQHALILAVCSPIAGITCSARTDGALNPRLDGQTGSNDRGIDDSLLGGNLNGKCRVRA